MNILTILFIESFDITLINYIGKYINVQQVFEELKAAALQKMN